MLFGGLMFAGVGSLFVLVGLFIILPTDFGMGLFWIVFSSIFVAVGIKLIYNDLNKKKRDKITVRDGHKIPNCKIVEYDDDRSILINGVPLLKIICLDESTQMVYNMDTGTTDERKYPIGSYIDLYELNGYVTIDKNSVRSEVSHYGQSR